MACACSPSLAKNSIRKDLWISAFVMALYCTNRFLLKPSAPDNLLGYLIRCHVNDYLGGILFLAYTNILIGTYLDAGKRIVTIIPTILVGAVCSLCWEGLAPMLLSYSTADILDCVAYLLGSITYWVINKMLRDPLSACDSRKEEKQYG